MSASPLPWEKYSQAAASVEGPWQKYAAPASATSAPAQETQSWSDQHPGELPLTSHWAATEQGLANIGEGVMQAGQGAYNMIRHPIDTARSIAQLPGQSLQIPGALKDIATASGRAPLGEYGRIIGNAAGQTAATAAMSEAPGMIRDFVKPAASRALLLGRTPEEAYGSALKPSTTLSEAQRANLVNTGLKEGIPVSKAGLETIADKIDKLNTQIKAEIDSGTRQGVTVDPNAVAARTASTSAKFANQVNPTADLQAIDAAKQEFLQNNPNPMSAADAQSMKQGTYRVLGGKAYGEMKSASVEAQKALARGLKEELAQQFPELQKLNASESRLLDLQPVIERAVNRIGNHQLLGIGTPIAAGATKAVTGSGGLAAVAGILKAVVDDPIVKSRLAISLSKASGAPPASGLARVAAYSAALGSATNANREERSSEPLQ